MKHIISLSGGKDSTAMLLMMIEKKMPIDRIICVDTTKEFPAMYRHIEKLKEYIKPLEIEIVKVDFDYWFGEHIKNNKEKGYGWADFKVRWCTRLKRDAINAILYFDEEYNPRKVYPYKIKKKKNIIEYYGIAYDERKRIQNQNDTRKNISYPLVEWGITEKQALEYCYSKGFDWEGLYKKFNRVSCWCCPLQRISELEILYNDFPELWQGLKEMDKKSYRRFRPDYTLNQLERRFKEKEKQLCLIGEGKDV